MCIQVQVHVPGHGVQFPTLNKGTRRSFSFTAVWLRIE